MGYTDVTVAGLKVYKQEVALVSEAYWNGDELTSGLIGFAYASITSAFIGDNATLDNANVTGKATGDQAPYSPVVQTMISQGLNPPLFSLALMRSAGDSDNSAGGYVALGGLPPVAFNPVFASTPIEIVGTSRSPSSRNSWSWLVYADVYTVRILQIPTPYRLCTQFLHHQTAGLRLFQ